MAKLKEMFSADNMKNFVLKHGEKVVLSIVCLFIVFALLGTEWFAYEKRPGQLDEKLKQASQTIEQGTWPEPEQEKYPPLNVQDEVNDMLAEKSAVPFALSTNFVGSIHGADEPRKEVELLAVMDLKADSGRTILAQSTDPPESESLDSEMEDGTAPDDTTTEPNDSDLQLDDVASRPTNTGLMEGDGMMESNPYGGAGYEEELMVSYDPSQMVLDESMYADSAGMEMGMGMDGMGMGLPSSVKGVPVRYISVRGIYDLRKQVLNYAKALSVPETEAFRLVEFLDFKLERQVADSSKGPWEEWEPVDIEVALDYLDQTVDFDPDVVSVGVRNPVITMPLPARLLGVWRNKVNHPRVKNFELSDAEIELEMMLNREILEQAREKNKAIKQKRAPGGFAKQQLDVSSMQQDYFNETDSRTISRSLEDEFKGTPAEVRQKLIEKIKAQVTASGNLVLFRYIDFDVLPGKSYRYRVSLVLRNPNFDQPVERVVHPSVVEGDTRETPVSEPSNVASVSPDYAYFVTRVSPPRGVTPEQADMQIFQWYDETGTMIRGTLSMEPGDFISGKAKTHVLDPAAFKFEEEDDVPFKTDDLMVDALVMGRLDMRMHEDLKLPRNLTRGEVGVTPQVLVVNKEGKLQELDPITMASTRDSYERYYEAEKKPFESIKDASKKMSETSELDMLLGEDESMMMEMMEGMDGAGRLRGRQRNPTRRSGVVSE
ncbi:hypothetical protein [Rubinisphaera sp. JC750]|uniref:hypothetical protein n=1 Tax=Rubinisphaera sp. JC750 TaxID=2898658 RepID=UPI001F1869A5|nr:hypothetical protein [Rubinisphaera sp. JC750]